MNMKKTYAVLGLGRYGTAVAQELAAAGAEVLAVDVNQKYIYYKVRARARMGELGVPSVFLRSSFGNDSVKVQSDNGVVSEW